ncbi:TRAP transporter small permease subunit [Vineibacter terrae]|uniref:TRAP transporter small permease subunit n=1 Tax=Vineibacter terrae TaxID=2586908 RepID=UPI002E319699|nr:TRAP transporter small permease subunit [Vineibacter terrae]HEX2887034.1 TRAP transporter small permease subunit [Vineibacter terrae]
MAALQRFADIVDRLNDRIGACAAWLIVPVIALLFLQIPLREVVGKGNLLANDGGQLLHATVFIVGVTYTLRWNGHVRVDLFYSRLPPRRQAWITLLGAAVLMLPWLWLTGRWSIPIALQSWRQLETFPETGSPGYFHFKTLLLAYVLLVGLQALAMMARAVTTLLDRPGDASGT